MIFSRLNKKLCNCRVQLLFLTGLFFSMCVMHLMCSVFHFAILWKWSLPVFVLQLLQSATSIRLLAGGLTRWMYEISEWNSQPSSCLWKVSNEMLFHDLTQPVQERLEPMRLVDLMHKSSHPARHRRGGAEELLRRKTVSPNTQQASSFNQSPNVLMCTQVSFVPCTPASRATSCRAFEATVRLQMSSTTPTDP